MEFLAAALALFGWLMAVLGGFGLAQDERIKTQVACGLSFVSFGLIVLGFWIK